MSHSMYNTESQIPNSLSLYLNNNTDNTNNSNNNQRSLETLTMADPTYLPIDNDVYYTFDDIYLPSDTEDFLNSLPLSSDPASDLLSLPFPPEDDTFSADVADFLNSDNSASLPFSYVSNNFDNLANSQVLGDSEDSHVLENSYVSNDLDNLVVEFVDSSSDSANCPNSGNSISPYSYVSNNLDNLVVDFVDSSGDSANCPNSGDSANCPNSGDSISPNLSEYNNLDNLVVDFVDSSGDPANCPNSGDSVSPNLCENNNLVIDSDESANEDTCRISEDPNSGNSVSPNSYVSNDLVNDKVPSRVLENSSPGPASSHRSGNSGNSRTSVVDQRIKLEEETNNSGSKRKKSGENSDLSDSRTSKFRKSNEFESTDVNLDANLDEDEKRVARLMRNRESAQLSRQRKKHYVEELEDKVRAMHSTIQDLNTKISYVMAENASLRSNGAAPPGMYPHPPMGYPWVPCPPYMVKPQGSQVPLVPIPRLKPQQIVSVPKTKRGESKSKTKKVASVSLLGLLVFMLLFGGLMPMVNLKFREMNDSVSGRLEFFNNRVFNDQRKGRVLTSVNGSDHNIDIGQGGGNSSEPLVASLFVPRNDKLVKIDGNLIIHSVMASEKALASSRDREMNRSEKTSLAVARSNVPSVIPLTGRNMQSHTYRGPAERQRALGGEKDKLMSSSSDGKLQQWFRDGLAGPMLSSGMCTEVFQFDISPAAGAIVPAPVVNVTSETQHPKNSMTQLVKGRNRRILHGNHVPLVSSKSNVTQKPAGIDPEKDDFRRNNSLSSMVVSVLVDPREVGEGNGDGVMGPKSISRIFVVVLIDSVKYVTYSCMLPLIGSGAHLVTT